MFTGIIIEKGKVLDIIEQKNSKTITFSGNKVLKNAKIGDSICVSGVCLTIVELSLSYFKADLMNETLSRTIFNNIKIGDSVNLEPSLTIDDYLDGHLVYGDVDFCTEILSIEEVGFAKIYKFKSNLDYLKYFVSKGRVVIDGVSLTLIEVNSKYFSVSLIPHTLKNVTLGEKNIGSLVNIESDILAKHLEKIASGHSQEVIKEFFRIKKIVQAGSND